MVEVTAQVPPTAPDVYFTGEYGRLDAQTVGGKWSMLADNEGAWQMPVVISEIEHGACEAASPYGYSGIYLWPDLSEADAKTAWGASTSFLEKAGVVSLFLRFSPLDPRSSQAANALPGLTIVRSGTTYLVNVTDVESMWTAMEGRARTAIRKARQQGMTGRVRRLEPKDLESGAPFRELYEGTMRRVGAAERYYFGDAYFAQFAQMTDADVFLAEVADGQNVVASALVMRHAENAHYHLSGSNPEAARKGANAILIWSILEWCAESGVKLCHLGGGLTEQDGLAKFKRSFGGEAADFYTGRAVIDKAAYSRLTRARADELGTTVVALEETGFFPAFRVGAA